MNKFKEKKITISVYLTSNSVCFFWSQGELNDAIPNLSMEGWSLYYSVREQDQDEAPHPGGRLQRQRAVQQVLIRFNPS